MSVEPDLADLDRRLSTLEAESDRRRAELSAVIGDLPAAQSRRTLLVSVLRDLRAAPKWSIVSRGIRKISRIPAALSRRISSRVKK